MTKLKMGLPSIENPGQAIQEVSHTFVMEVQKADLNSGFGTYHAKRQRDAWGRTTCAIAEQQPFWNPNAVSGPRKVSCVNV